MGEEVNGFEISRQVRVSASFFPERILVSCLAGRQAAPGTENFARLLEKIGD